MPNLRRILPLATVAAAAFAFVPTATAAVQIQAPAEVAAPGTIAFSATASAGSKVVRKRRGSHVAASRKVTRVTGKGSKGTSISITPTNTGGNNGSSSGNGTGNGSSSNSSGGSSGKGSTTPTKPTTPVTPPVTTTPPVRETPTTPITTPTSPITTPPTTPTPPSTPVAEAPSSGALFSSSSIRAFQVDHSAPGAINEVPDPLGSGAKVISMTVNNADVYPVTPTENPRAELISQPLVSNGQEVWLHTKFLVPTEYPAVPEGGWVSLLSFYGAPFAGPSPFHLEIDGDKLQWQRNETYGWDIPYSSTLEKGKWTDVLVHEKFASNGFLELWINGQQVNFFGPGSLNPSHHAATTKLEMATMDSTNDGAPNAAKIMQYRQAGMFETGTIYFNGLQVGASRASVGA